MPSLEAPAKLDDSSPDSSVSQQEFIAPGAAEFLVAPAPIRHEVPVPPNIVQVQSTRRRLLHTSLYDRDVPTLEEDNHWPTRPYLLPVVLPPVHEPTLDELLRRVTGRNDLHNVDTVRLRVISFSVSLSSLSLFLPRLQQLNLSGSVLSSLRDLGCGLTQLSHLNVSNCGLNSFDGTSGLPAVRVLIADGNMIQRVGPLAELTMLQRLSIQNNRISDLSLLSFLGMCPNLTELQLQGNPVCHLTLYRITLQRNVQFLEMLDGQPLIPCNPTASATIPNTALDIIPGPNYSHSSTDGEISSLSSHIYSDRSSDSMGSNGGPNNRPATAPSDSNSAIIESNSRIQLCRPSSVLAERRRSANSLSMSAPLAGSVLNLTRHTRRRRGYIGNAWLSSSSSAASTSPSPSMQQPSGASSEESLECQHEQGRIEEGPND